MSVTFFAPSPMIPYESTQSRFISIVDIDGVRLIDTTQLLAWPIEVAVGQLAVAIGVGQSQLTSAGWTTGTETADQGVGGINFISYMYKVVASGDISSPPTITIPTYGGFYMLLYDGPTAAKIMSTATPTEEDDVHVDGFVRTPGSRMVLAIGSDRDLDFNLDLIGPVDKFTQRALENSAYFSLQVCDIKSSFYNEGPVSMDLLTGGSFEGSACLMELTG